MRARTQIVVKVVVGILAALAVLVTFNYTGVISQDALIPGTVAAGFAVLIVTGLRFK